MVVYDEVHSMDEERFITIGPILRGLITVVWMEPAEDVIRLISARFADAQERDLYQQYMERRDG